MNVCSKPCGLLSSGNHRAKPMRACLSREEARRRRAERVVVVAQVDVFGLYAVQREAQAYGDYCFDLRRVWPSPISSCPGDGPLKRSPSPGTCHAAPL